MHNYVYLRRTTKAVKIGGGDSLYMDKSAKSGKWKNLEDKSN